MAKTKNYLNIVFLVITTVLAVSMVSVWIVAKDFQGSALTVSMTTNASGNVNSNVNAMTNVNSASNSNTSANLNTNTTSSANTNVSKQTAASNGIRSELSAKYDSIEEDITVDVSKFEDHYARGTYRIGQPEVGSGGWFLATDISGSWEVIDDGNGVIECAKFTALNFPTSMLTDCVTLTTNR